MTEVYGKSRRIDVEVRRLDAVPTSSRGHDETRSQSGYRSRRIPARDEKDPNQ
jgi:hypothetical protein